METTSRAGAMTSAMIGAITRDLSGAVTGPMISLGLDMTSPGIALTTSRIQVVTIERRIARVWVHVFAVSIRIPDRKAIGGL